MTLILYERERRELGSFYRRLRDASSSILSHCETRPRAGNRDAWLGFEGGIVKISRYRRLDIDLGPPVAGFLASSRHRGGGESGLRRCPSWPLGFLWELCLSSQRWWLLEWETGRARQGGGQGHFSPSALLIFALGRGLWPGGSIWLGLAWPGLVWPAEAQANTWKTSRSGPPQALFPLESVTCKWRCVD